MPATTAGYKLPYPVGTDRLMDGDDQIRKLAQAVENLVQTGTATINVTAANTPVSLAVTFPVAFQATPVVTVTPVTNNPHQVFGSVTARSATGCTVWAARNTGSGSTDVMWTAVGPINAVT